MKQSYKIAASIAIVFTFLWGVQSVAASILQGFQGGTGYGSTSSSNVGKALIVASSSPYLTWTFGSAGGGGSATTTPFTTGQVAVASSGYVATLDAPTDTIQRFLSSTGNGSTSGAVSWQVIPVAGYQNYYMTASSSDVASNLQLQAAPQTTLASSTATSLAAGTSSVQYFVTNTGAPNITSIPSGVFQVSFTARQTVTGGANVQLYGVVNEVNSTGTKIATIETTNLTTALTSASTTYNVYADMPNPYIMASSTSRIQLQIVAYVSGGGTPPTAKIYYGNGADDSRLVFPSAAVSARTYVPYSGATNNVNLGVYGLTSTGITSTAIHDSGLGSALVLSTSGSLGNYGGSTACGAGNAVTTISATGATTCAPFLTSYSVIAGTGISVATTTTSATITNTGVISLVAGTGISLSSATGTPTITNTGVISLNGSTGAVTLAVPSIATTTKGAWVSNGGSAITTTTFVLWTNDTGTTTTLKKFSCLNTSANGNTFTANLGVSTTVNISTGTLFALPFTCNSTSTIQSTSTSASIPPNAIVQAFISTASTTGAFVQFDF